MSDIEESLVMMETTPVRRVRILLVEDNYGDVLLTQQAFSQATFPYEMTVARDGEQAVELLMNNHDHQPRPDLILLDINMPKMDGKEVLAAVKKDPVLKTIPVIMLTSSNAERDVLESRALKADGYLLKPLDFGRFFKLYERLKH